MTPTISIIVPVYKVERYLAQCIDSILAQTFTDFELILIDDGSPDSCGRICDEYATKDKRVRAFHKPNGGLSDARNFGIKQANGQYIGFVDSDDYIQPNMYEHLFKLATKHHADIASINTLKLYSNGDLVKGNKHTGLILWDKKDCLKDYFSDTHIYPHSAWSKLYRRDLFNDIEFPKGLTCEDTYASLMTLLKSTVLVQDCDAFMYVYRMTPNSITKTFNVHTFDQFYILCKCCDNLDSPSIKAMCAKRIVRNYISTMGFVYRDKMYYKDQAFVEKIADIKRLLPKYKKLTKLRLSERIPLCIIGLSPTFFSKLYALKKIRKGVVDSRAKDEEIYNLGVNYV